MKNELLTTEDLEQYKRIQKLAYEAAQYTFTQLAEGMTEKEAVKIMKKYLQDKGVSGFFHLPFAWFGDRTAFKNFSIPMSFKTHQKFKISLPSFKNPLPHFGFEFQPSNKKLELGMPVILDVAPSINGDAADIGYSESFGENETMKQAKKDLLKFRELILKKAQEKKTMAQIYQACDVLMQELGYDNCHSIYPQGVLGHKLGKLPFANAPKISFMGFQLQTYLYLIKHFILQLLGKSTGPLWNHESNHQLSPGLWAVEPHIGKGNVGAKFEEILVVTTDKIYWLDDELPHMQ